MSNFSLLFSTRTRSPCERIKRKSCALCGNTVRNSALKSAPDDDRQLMFLGFIDDFTASHIRVLAVLNDPPAAVKATGKRDAPPPAD